MALLVLILDGHSWVANMAQTLPCLDMRSKALSPVYATLYFFATWKSLSLCNGKRAYPLRPFLPCIPPADRRLQSVQYCGISPSMHYASRQVKSQLMILLLKSHECPPQETRRRSQDTSPSICRSLTRGAVTQSGTALLATVSQWPISAMNQNLYVATRGIASPARKSPTDGATSPPPQLCWIPELASLSTIPWSSRRISSCFTSR